MCAQDQMFVTMACPSTRYRLTITRRTCIRDINKEDKERSVAQCSHFCSSAFYRLTYRRFTLMDDSKDVEESMNPESGSDSSCEIVDPGKPPLKIDEIGALLYSMLGELRSWAFPKTPEYESVRNQVQDLDTAIQTALDQIHADEQKLNGIFLDHHNQHYLKMLQLKEDWLSWKDCWCFYCECAGIVL